jgi:branched-subunit amino acid permease
MGIVTAAADALAAVFNHAAFGAARACSNFQKRLGYGGMMHIITYGIPVLNNIFEILIFVTCDQVQEK